MSSNPFDEVEVEEYDPDLDGDDRINDLTDQDEEALQAFVKEVEEEVGNGEEDR